MNTSELIKKLQSIDKTVPFDAEVVTGDDWNFQKIEKVYHEALRTFIDFGSPVMGESATEQQDKERLIDQIITLLKKIPAHLKLFLCLMSFTKAYKKTPKARTPRAF